MEQFQKLKQQLQETVRQRMDMSSELSDAQIGEIWRGGGRRCRR